nr:hypothetical protein [Oceanococcus sp. HetDA_MAG_MS8]
MPKDKYPEEPMIEGRLWVSVIVVHISISLGVVAWLMVRGEVRLIGVFTLTVALWMNERNLRQGAVGVNAHVMSYKSSPFQYWLFIFGWYSAAGFGVYLAFLE